MSPRRRTRPGVGRSGGAHGALDASGRSLPGAAHRWDRTDSPVRSAGVRATDPCPCGTGEPFEACCGPVIDGAPAATAEALMRSRYSAFVVGDEDHLFRTWWPRTRPQGPYCHAGTRWTGLAVHEVRGGGTDEEDGAEAVVDFTATFQTGDGYGAVVDDVLHERSLFRRRAGRWLYVRSL